MLRLHFKYWILPSLVTIALMLLYFFDFFSLSFIVAPEYNREFGILENLQLALIALVAYFFFMLFKVQPPSLLKYLYLSGCLFSLLIFLEEMDYGLHFYNHFAGNDPETAIVFANETEFRNLHNVGSRTSTVKTILFILMVLFFVVFPLLAEKKIFGLQKLDFFVPHRFFVLSLIAMALLNEAALYLSRNMDFSNPALVGNISEFQETFVYYIFAVYLYDLLKKLRNRLPAKTGPGGSAVI